MAKTSDGVPVQGFWLWVDAPPPGESLHVMWWGDRMMNVGKCAGCGRFYAKRIVRTGRTRQYCSHVCAAATGRMT